MTERRHSRLRIAAGLALAAVTLQFATPAPASDIPVDLELILAVDVSGSMDFEELQVQRRGYVEALRHPDVMQAIESGIFGRIAVTMIEWAGPFSQRTVMPWRMIDTEADAISASEVVEAQPVSNMRGTSIAGLLDYTRDMFDGNGFQGTRQVIDISGDGPNRSGGPVTVARDRTVERGIVINGLPIVLKPGFWATSSLSPEDLEIYYEDCVIGGFASFIIGVREKEELVTAIRRKMILEIALSQPRVLPAQVSTTVPRIDCRIGERLWQEQRIYIE
jgi:hypothetical protein